MDGYLIFEAEYEPHATDAQRSLGWVAPELVDAGLTMTYDMLGVRKWAGFIDGDTFEGFVDSWGGDAQLANYRHTWDGMEWESGGSSPVVWASLTATALEPVTKSAVRLSGLRQTAPSIRSNKHGTGTNTHTNGSGTEAIH